jgi:hypothetical protein
MGGLIGRYVGLGALMRRGLIWVLKRAWRWERPVYAKMTWRAASAAAAEEAVAVVCRAEVTHGLVLVQQGWNDT